MALPLLQGVAKANRLVHIVEQLYCIALQCGMLTPTILANTAGLHMQAAEVPEGLRMPLEAVRSASYLARISDSPDPARASDKRGHRANGWERVAGQPFRREHT